MSLRWGEGKWFSSFLLVMSLNTGTMPQFNSFDLTDGVELICISISLSKKTICILIATFYCLVSVELHTHTHTHTHTGQWACTSPRSFSDSRTQIISETTPLQCREPHLLQAIRQQLAEYPLVIPQSRTDPSLVSWPRSSLRPQQSLELRAPTEPPP